MAELRLGTELIAILDNRRYVIALSGGLDSMVLLDLFSRALPADALHVVHVNHHLHPKARDWEAHCEHAARLRGITFTAIQIKNLPMHNLESAARRARYEAFLSVLGANDVLCTAHHQQDQVESVLMALCRGSGLVGLAGMPQWLALGHAMHWRPLLACAHTTLQDYARTHALSWVNDTSNDDVRFTRNWIRTSVLPLLESRMPSLQKCIARTAVHCQDALQIQDHVVERLYLQIKITPEELNATALFQLDQPLQTALIRYWLREHAILPPPQKRLITWCTQCMSAKQDKQPILAWDLWSLRRWRNSIYLISREMVSVPVQHTWCLATSYYHPVLKRTLYATQGSSGLVLPDNVAVRYDQPGFKKYWQRAAVPPWQRAYYPMIYVEDTCVAIPGVYLKQDHPRSEVGWTLRLV